MQYTRYYVRSYMPFHLSLPLRTSKDDDPYHCQRGRPAHRALPAPAPAGGGADLRGVRLPDLVGAQVSRRTGGHVLEGGLADRVRLSLGDGVLGRAAGAGGIALQGSGRLRVVGGVGAP